MTEASGRNPGRDVRVRPAKSKATAVPEEATEALRTVIDALPSAAAVIDARGQVRAENSGWHALQSDPALQPGLVGTARSLVGALDCVGGAFEAHLRETQGRLRNAARVLLAALAEARRGGRPAAVPYEVRGPDGEVRHLQVTVRPLAGWGLVLVQHEDATDTVRGQAAQQRILELGVQLEAAASHARRQREILHAMAQETNAPVTPVLLQLHLLRSGAFGALGPDQERALGVIERNVRRWGHVTGAFLASVAEDATQAVPEAVDLGEAVDQVARAESGRALRLGIRLQATLPKDPLPVRIDPRSLRDILRAYIDYALESSHAGTTLEVVARPAGPECIAEVHYSGLPLPPHALAAEGMPGPAGVRLHRCRLLAQEANGRAYGATGASGSVLGMGLPRQ